jgi:acetyl/propionyl-CoA carboxylase alpha subunit
VDDGIETGTAVTPYYDPMLAKIITWGADRAEAVAKMERALRETAVLGVTTNIPYLLAILGEPHFRAGQTSTSYLQEHLADWSPAAEASAAEWVGTAVFELLHGAGKGGTGKTVSADSITQPDPWHTVSNWRNVQV